MSISIENEALLKNNLAKGICLFTGSGFSVLPSPTGATLPTGTGLCKDAIKHFNLEDVSEEDGLPYISQLCPDSDYQDFLREKFSVSDYNPLYNVINAINLKAFITTNIDNIIRLVVTNGNRYYIKNIREYGATYYNPCELVYIPLHGDVTDVSSRLYFGKFELSDVDMVNRDLFSQMQGILSQHPILFWGYSFNDSGVLKTIKDIVAKNPSNIWIQTRKGDKKTQRLFKEIGCNIIVADTDELLVWVEKNRPQTSHIDGDEEIASDPELARYRIPTIDSVPVVPMQDFFCEGTTAWYPVIQRLPYERAVVASAQDKALTCKNVIITGCRFSGKTIALMQLARRIGSPNKFFVQGVTKEESSFIIKRIAGKKAWVFYDNCCNDIDAFLAFAKEKNITLIGASDDYLLETVRHILSQALGSSYTVINCSEISRAESQQMYNSLPPGLRNNTHHYTDEPNEKYTMLEFISNNVKQALTEQHVRRILKEIDSDSPDLFSIISLAAYLEKNGSAISYGNVAHLLDINVFPEAVTCTKAAGHYLREYNYSIVPSEFDGYQDFFQLRSKRFNYFAEKILLKDYKEDYKKTIKWVIQSESQYSIFRYDVFRRSAFDSELFYKAFDYADAMRIYDYLFDCEDNPFTLQQKALCQALFGHYQEAFANIDMALSRLPENFSFKNSQAIILFEANHKNHVAGSIGYMNQAMQILEKCYSNDKRKLYHAQKFAEFAIILCDEYAITDYLEKAQAWLQEMIEAGGNEASPRTKTLVSRLSQHLSR